MDGEECEDGDITEPIASCTSLTPASPRENGRHEVIHNWQNQSNCLLPQKNHMESTFKDNPHYHQVLQLPQDTDLLVTGVGSVSPVPGSHLPHHDHHHICDYFAALSMLSIIAMIIFSCHLTRIKNPGPLDTQSLSEISTSDIPPGIPCDSANSQVRHLSTAFS